MKTQCELLKISCKKANKKILYISVVPLKKIASFKENSNFYGWMATKLKVVGIWNFQENIATFSRECNSSFAFIRYYNL